MRIFLLPLSILLILLLGWGVYRLVQKRSQGEAILKKSHAPFLLAGFLFNLLLSSASFWFFYMMFLKWDFNEEGRYYDEVDQVVYNSSGVVFVIPAVFFLLLSLAMGIIYRRLKKRA